MKCFSCIYLFFFFFNVYVGDNAALLRLFLPRPLPPPPLHHYPHPLPCATTPSPILTPTPAPILLLSQTPFPTPTSTPTPHPYLSPYVYPNPKHRRYSHPTLPFCRLFKRYLLRHPGRDVDLDPEGTGVVRVVSASGAKHKLRCDSTKVRAMSRWVGVYLRATPRCKYFTVQNRFVNFYPAHRPRPNPRDPNPSVVGGVGVGKDGRAALPGVVRWRF